MSFMGLDVGQTGCRAMIFSEQGKQISSSYMEYETLVHQPGWAELDSKKVVESCFTVIKNAVKDALSDPVRGLGISTMGEAFTPVGPDGRYLANAMITFDTRAAPLTGSWSRDFGLEKLYKITGHTAHPMFSIFKLLWLKENRKDVFKKAVKFLCFEDLVQNALGLDPHISWCLAGRTMMFNVIKHEFDDEILDAAGIKTSRLAVPVQSGKKIGVIPRGIAAGLGFTEEVTVASAGHDQPLGALGAGVTDPGRAMYATGTSECITPAFPGPVLTEDLFKNNLCTYDYVLEGMYTTVGFSLTGGNILKWFRDEWGQPEALESESKGIDTYELLLEKIGDKPTGLFVLPYFTPSGTPYFDTRVPGALLGLRLSTKRGEVLRALLEGVAFEMRLNLDILDNSGIAIKELRAIGGGAKSKIWTQLKADVLNKPITTVEVTEAACFGAAILSCAALTGEPADSIARSWVKTGPVIHPRPENSEVYSSRFQTYKKLYPTLKELDFL
jgi:xylulokinase